MGSEIFLLAALALLGAAAGLLAGLLGVGGGTVLVPALYVLGHTLYADSFSPDQVMHSAIGTSLAVIIPTGLSAAWAQSRRGMINWKVVRLMAPGQVIGVVLGVWAISFLRGNFLQLIFAIGLFGLSFLTAKKIEPKHIRPAWLERKYASLASLGIGFISSLLGIGGAILTVPYLSFSGVAFREAIASASVLGVLVAFPAAVGFAVIGGGEAMPDYFWGYLNLKAWVLIVPFSMMIAPFGVRLSHVLPVPQLRGGFAVFLAIVACKMLWDATNG